MANPFKKLKEEYIVNSGWEEVDGPMTCLTPGCHTTARTGKYSEKLKVVTWMCPEGHISKMENYTL